MRRAFGAPGRTKPAADQRAGRAGLDQADRQPAATQPLTPRLSLAGPSARPLAEPTLPLAYPAQPEANEGQPADALGGEATEQRLSAYQQDAGQAAVPDQVGQRLGDIASGLARQGRAGADWTIRLAANRAVAPNSVTGISLLLGLCAAVWFSGGTRQDEVSGLITTGVWVAVRAGARLLAAVTAQRASQPGGHAAPVGRRRQRQPDHSDWLVLPGFDWAADNLPDRPAIQRDGLRRARGQNFSWFYAVCSTAAECAVYGGIAAGAESAGWKASWPLAVAIVIVGSIAAIARACGASAQGAVPGASDRDATRVLGALGSLTFPAIGVRVLLAALITVGYTPRIALVAVLAAGVVSLAGNLSRTGGRIAAGVRAGAASPPAARTAAVATQDMLLACRDDGPLARRAGWLVRGNLMPVPPAIAGLVAIALLAVLGIKNLPGIVALTPIVVMLLAAPGSSHPHDGRFDWLVPMLLCLAQYIYIAALGAAESVSWPVVFATCSMTATWYASLVASRVLATPDTTPSRRKTRVTQIMGRRTEGIGWEGRISVVGLAGMLGIATFGYLGLMACLGALIGRKLFIDYLRQGEDQRQ